MFWLIVILIAGFAFYVSRQPDEFRVMRTAAMSAPPEKVFTQVNDLHAWEAWSPWARLDPNAKNSYEGPASGTGAVMRWQGNNKVGQGSMTITESRAPELLRFRLEFLKPMKATNTAEFAFRTEGNQTIVTWTMEGKNNFVGKAMNVVMNCSKMVGGQFEQGLANLKAIVEKA